MDTQTTIELMLQSVRSKILQEFRADSCIASTAVGIDVLTRFGILAEPLAVRLMIFNKPFVANVEKNGFPSGPEELNQRSKTDGSYSVGIGYGVQQPGKWAGHLVLIAEKKYLIDLSIDQANRPNYQMIFDPLCVEINEDFLKGKPLIFQYNECIFRYDAQLQNLGYQASPDWMFFNRRSRIVDQTFLEMKNE